MPTVMQKKHLSGLALILSVIILGVVVLRSTNVCQNPSIWSSHNIVYKEEENRCSKGCLGLSEEFLIQQAPLFGTVYDKRPARIQNGNTINHQFALWFMV